MLQRTMWKPVLALSLAPVLAALGGPAPSLAPQAEGDGAQAARGYLGIHVEEGHPGVRVLRVVPKSGAARAGLEAGDLLLGVEGTELGGFDDLQAVLADKRVGAEVDLRLRRGDSEIELSAVLGERPTEEDSPRGRVRHEGGDGVSSERLHELFERRQDFEEEWRAELEEHLEEMRERLREGWDDLQDSLESMVEPRGDELQGQAMRNWMQAREELERWHESRQRAMREWQSQLREPPRPGPWTHGPGHGWSPFTVPSPEVRPFEYSPLRPAPPQAPHAPDVPHAWSDPGTFGRGQADEWRELQESFRELRDEVRDLRSEVRELRERLSER